MLKMYELINAGNSKVLKNLCIYVYRQQIALTYMYIASK